MFQRIYLYITKSPSIRLAAKAGEICGKLAIFIAIVQYVWESGERAKQKHYRAWELINSAAGKPGDGGRRDALLDLAKDGVSLRGAMLSLSHLPNINLEGADLSGAILCGANLDSSNLQNANLHAIDGRSATFNGANLSEATMMIGNFSKAFFMGTNLSNTKVSASNFSEAVLIGANFRGSDITSTKFNGANLQKADFRDAKGSNAKFDGARFCETIMPDGSIKNDGCKNLTPQETNDRIKHLVENVLPEASDIKAVNHCK